jgi:hypothetical protein
MGLATHGLHRSNAQEPAMIFAAGVAAQAATALAQALQNKNKPGSTSNSTSTDFANLTADIDALLPGGAAAGSNGVGSGTGSVGGDVVSLGSDLLGSLGLNPDGTTGTSAASAAQAYAQAHTLGA